MEEMKRKAFKEKQQLLLKLDLRNLGQLNRDQEFIEFRKKPHKEKLKLYNLTKTTEKQLLKEL